MASKFLLLSVFVSCAVLATFIGEADGLCSYNIRVKTGTQFGSGTDAKVSLQLFDRFNNKVDIPNLENWGVMAPGYDYFESGHFDFFAGMSNCLRGPVCMINLSHDMSGSQASWFVDNVRVSSAFSTQPQLFPVDRWLASDEPPFTLFVVVNRCVSANGKEGEIEIEQVTNV